MITPNNNEYEFYDNSNSTDNPFSDDDHQINIYCKHYNISKLNTLNIKEKYFVILYLTIASLRAHIDDLHNFLGTLDFKFFEIGLSERKIDTNTPIKYIDLPGYSFCYDKTKGSYCRTCFFYF